MVARINTVAFQGVQAVEVDVQVQISNGLPAFTIVGLPDKAVAESRERVRAALGAIGLALPPKRITVNLAPADMLKEGSHFDLPIALGLLAAMDVMETEDLAEFVVLGELGLDGALAPVAGVLPAAIAASSPSAIGRSKWLPSFNKSAGDRLTVIRRGGRARPMATSAARTRSRDSATALSGRPTTVNAGRPPAICT